MMALAGGLVGLIMGSFVAVLTLRWPAGAGFAWGRSRCDHCAAVLGPRDLVPVVSFALLGGRCRQCGGVIAARHLAIELAAGMIGALAFIADSGGGGVAGAVFGWLLLALAILDGEHFWLPRALTVTLAATGLLAGLWLAPPLVDRVIGLVAGGASLALVAAFYRGITGRDGLGGGDPWLLAGIGGWLGWGSLPFVLLLAASLGLFLVLLDRARGRPVSRHSRVPFGALLAAAAWPLWVLAPLN